MKVNFKKYTIDQYLVFLLILFTFGIIGSKTINIYGSDILVEISLVPGVLFLISRILKIKKEKSNYFEFWGKNKFFLGIIILFSICTVIKAFNLHWTFYPYSLNKIFPFILFIFLIIYLKNENKKILKEYLKFSSYIFIISFILAILIYLLGYTNGAFSLSQGLYLISKEESLNLYQEIRLYWLLSHKSRFAIYCTLGFLFIVNSKFKNNIILIIGIIGSLVTILLSKSMTGILIYFIVVLFYIINKYKILKRIFYSKQRNKILIILIILFLSTSIFFINFLRNKRDIKTMGSRTIIWEASLEKVMRNPLGVVKMPNDYWIMSKIDGNEVYFTNGHNIYINEMLENGILLGLIYFFINILIIFKLIKSKDYNFAMFMFLTLFVFGNLESINSREMNYILFLAYGIFYSLATKKENLTLVRGSVDE